MFSGKTTELIRQVRVYKQKKNVKILVVGYEFDDRYTKTMDLIQTHDGVQMKAYKISNIQPHREYLE